MALEIRCIALRKDESRNARSASPQIRERMSHLRFGSAIEKPVFFHGTPDTRLDMSFPRL
jgi:hypothetical protein